MLFLRLGLEMGPPSLVHFFLSSFQAQTRIKIMKENSCLSDFDEFILITRSPSCDQPNRNMITKTMEREHNKEREFG